MRILVVHPGASYSVADVHRGWVRGLRQCGVEVGDFNFDDRLEFYAKAHHDRDGDGTFVKSLTDEEAAIMAAAGIPSQVNVFQPDLIFIVSGFFVPTPYYDLWKSQGIKLALLCTESPYEDDRQFERSRYFDVVMLNDPANLDRFQGLNQQTWYVPHAYDPDIHCPGPVEPDAVSDFCFVGSGYRERIDFFNAVNWQDIDFALAGNWGEIHGTELEQYLAHRLDHCVRNEDAVQLYRATKASANLYRRQAERPELVDGFAMGPREVELAATGCFYLTEPREENRRILPMIPTFDGPQDFEQKLRWYLAHPDERDEIALKARDAISGRTFASHAADFLRRVGY